MKEEKILCFYCACKHVLYTEGKTFSALGREIGPHAHYSFLHFNKRIRSCAKSNLIWALTID